MSNRQADIQGRCHFVAGGRFICRAGGDSNTGSSSRDVGCTLPAQHPLAPNALLKFSLVQSTRRDVAAPYASLSAGRHAAATANPLFTLSRYTDAGATTSDSGSDTSRRAGSGSGAGSSSEFESGSESSSTSDLHLERIQCQLCHRPLSQRGGSKRFWQRPLRSHKQSNLFLVCDCCQRCFHEDCCKDKGISTHQDRKTGTWFHSSGCQDCHQGLKQQADAGSTPLPDGRSWQLVDCQPRSPKELGGVRALRELKANLGDVLEVLLAAYGPGAAQQLVNTGNGYAVLLRKQDKEPVTAGLLDVYGKDLAVLDLVATLSEEQGQGHCTALVGALEGWLGPQLGVASLMAVCPDNEPEVAKLWQSKFGFKRLTKKQLSQLQASVPPLNYYEDSLLLTKQLPNKCAAEKSKGHKPAAAAAAAAAVTTAAAVGQPAATAAATSYRVQQVLQGDLSAAACVAEQK